MHVLNVHNLWGGNGGMFKSIIFANAHWNCSNNVLFCVGVHVGSMQMCNTFTRVSHGITTYLQYMHSSSLWNHYIFIMLPQEFLSKLLHIHDTFIGVPFEHITYLYSIFIVVLFESITYVQYLHRKFLWNYYNFVVLSWEFPLKLLQVCRTSIGVSFKTITYL